jgi:hypothetical protein
VQEIPPSNFIIIIVINDNLQGEYKILNKLNNLYVTHSLMELTLLEKLPIAQQLKK